MAMGILGSPTINLTVGDLVNADPAAVAVVWATSQRGVGALDITEITVFGDTANVTLTSGKVRYAKQIADLTNDVVAILFWVLAADLPAGQLSAVMVFSGTQSTSTLRTVVWSISSSTGFFTIDAQDGAAFQHAADPWNSTNFIGGTDAGDITPLVVAPNSLQLYSIGVTGTGTSAVKTGTVGTSFFERRDVNAGAHRMIAGDYVNAAGGSRDFNVDLASADTGAIVVVSFKELAATHSKGLAMMGVG